MTASGNLPVALSLCDNFIEDSFNQKFTAPKSATTLKRHWRTPGKKVIFINKHSSYHSIIYYSNGYYFPLLLAHIPSNYYARSAFHCHRSGTFQCMACRHLKASQRGVQGLNRLHHDDYHVMLMFIHQTYYRDKSYSLLDNLRWIITTFESSCAQTSIPCYYLLQNQKQLICHADR